MQGRENKELMKECPLIYASIMDKRVLYVFYGLLLQQ